MTDTYTQCPKCGHKPPQPMPTSESCPACGIYVYKWNKTPAAARASRGADADEDVFDEEDAGFIAGLLQPLDKMDTITFYGRGFVLALLAVWSWFLIGYDYRVAEISGSFIHNILLPIHEAGHVLLSPFGEFLTILGGSGFQLALPFAIGIAFIVKYRDNFGASIGLWWASVSLVDLSPYIYDALHPQMVLLGGRTGDDGGPHDWIYLLGTVGQVKHAQLWGMLAHTLGALFMVLTLAWGALVLVQQRKQGLDA